MEKFVTKFCIGCLSEWLAYLWMDGWMVRERYDFTSVDDYTIHFNMYCKHMALVMVVKKEASTHYLQ